MRPQDLEKTDSSIYLKNVTFLMRDVFFCTSYTFFHDPQLQATTFDSLIRLFNKFKAKRIANRLITMAHFRTNDPVEKDIDP